MAWFTEVKVSLEMFFVSASCLTLNAMKLVIWSEMLTGDHKVPTALWHYYLYTANRVPPRQLLTPPSRLPLECLDVSLPLAFSRPLCDFRRATVALPLLETRGAGEQKISVRLTCGFTCFAQVTLRQARPPAKGYVKPRE